MVEIYQELSQRLVDTREFICDFNTHFQQVYYRFQGNHTLSTEVIFTGIYNLFLKPLLCSFYKKGKTYFEEAWEDAQILEKDLKMYPLELFTFSPSYDVKCVEKEPKISEFY